MPAIHLFADSNLFLQCKPLREIDWPQLGDFGDIEVIVCRTVQREIDTLKNGRAGRCSDRARKAASTFLEIAQHGPEEQRAASPRVLLRLDRTLQPKRDLAAQLDYNQNDDCIIGYLAQSRAENPSVDARLLTGDSGPILTADSLGIPYLHTPDDWSLAPEKDDKDRKIQELTQQLKELQAQEPKFQFSCSRQSGARPGHVAIDYGAFRPLTAIERDQLLERLQTLYPRTVVNRNRISAKAITDYEERDHPAWISECKSFLGVVDRIVQLEHCPELTVSIQNNGSRPATNPLVVLGASGNFALTTPMSDLRELGLIPAVERPKPPDQPQPQASWSTILYNLTGSMVLTPSDLKFASRFRDQEGFEYTADVKLETERSIGFTCGLWRHALDPKEFTIRLVPATIDNPITGQITCTIHADNLTKPATFKLVVTLSPDYRPTLVPALRWFTTPHPNETRG